jgi:hypothetical protein
LDHTLEVSYAERGIADEVGASSLIDDTDVRAAGAA